MPGFACKGPKGRDGGLEEVRSSTRETRVRRCYSEPGGRPGRVPVHKSLAPPRRKKTTTLILREVGRSRGERNSASPWFSSQILLLNFTMQKEDFHHIKNVDTCMEY
jgi:hypothetical protein